MTDSAHQRHGFNDDHYKRLAVAVRELLVEKGVVTEEEIETFMARMGARSPELGARMVARAWTVPDYKERMLADGSAAASFNASAPAATRTPVPAKACFNSAYCRSSATTASNGRRRRACSAKRSTFL